MLLQSLILCLQLGVVLRELFLILLHLLIGIVHAGCDCFGVLQVAALESYFAGNEDVLVVVVAFDGDGEVRE